MFSQALMDLPSKARIKTARKAPVPILPFRYPSTSSIHSSCSRTSCALSDDPISVSSARSGFPSNRSPFAPSLLAESPEPHPNLVNGSVLEESKQSTIMSRPILARSTTKLIRRRRSDIDAEALPGGETEVQTDPTKGVDAEAETEADQFASFDIDAGYHCRPRSKLRNAFPIPQNLLLRSHHATAASSFQSGPRGNVGPALEAHMAQPGRQAQYHIELTEGIERCSSLLRPLNAQFTSVARSLNLLPKLEKRAREEHDTLSLDYVKEKKARISLSNQLNIQKGSVRQLRLDNDRLEIQLRECRASLAKEKVRVRKMGEEMKEARMKEERVEVELRRAKDRLNLVEKERRGREGSLQDMDDRSGTGLSPQLRRVIRREKEVTGIGRVEIKPENDIEPEQEIRRLREMAEDRIESSYSRGLRNLEEKKALYLQKLEVEKDILELRKKLEMTESGLLERDRLAQIKVEAGEREEKTGESIRRKGRNYVRVL